MSEKNAIPANAILKSALFGDLDAIRVAAEIPVDAWPDGETKSVGRAIRALTERGELVDGPGIYREMLREGDAPRGPAVILASITSPPDNGGAFATCDPERERRAIVEGYQNKRQAENIRMLDAAHRGGDSVAYREILDELRGDGPQDEAFCLPLQNWRKLASEPVPWAFNESIPDHVVTVIGGPGGMGKSAFARGLVLSTITGKTLFPSFVPTRKAPALVLSGEDSGQLYLHSLTALAREHDIPHDEMDAAIMNRLHLRALNAKPFLARDDRGNVGTTDYFQAVRREAKRTGAKVIVVDTLSKHFGGDSENDNAQIAAFIEACSGLAQEAQAAIIIIHHTRKNAPDGTAHHALRGGGAAGDNARAVWLLKREGDRVTAENVKQNYGRFSEPVDFEFRGAALVEVTENRDPRDLIPTVVQWLKENPDKRVTVGAITSTQGDGGYLRRHLNALHPWLQSRHIHPAISAAIEDGVLDDVKMYNPKSKRSGQYLQVRGCG